MSRDSLASGSTLTREQLDAELCKRMTERVWQADVVALAKANSWMVAHFRPAKTAEGWRTPVEGHAGFVDLVLARGEVVRPRHDVAGRSSCRTIPSCHPNEGSCRRADD